MQYLSKAYNYYSGINPATLSGAIDVIVVRHVDPDGNVVLASSPFHVRFGKLQVLRAAEKRVTIKMPNNLPPPHIVPFNMKVGESGEAFFVLETTDDVPEELLTSPVVMPTEDPPGLPEPSVSTEPETPGLLTKEPFGETERRVLHTDIDYFNLNDPPSHSHGPSTTNPPNPLSARPGESTGLPRNDKLSQHDPFSSMQADLPKVKPGEGEGPRVVYGSDVVLDIAGYHNEPDPHNSTTLDTFTKDLVEAINMPQRPRLSDHLTDPAATFTSTPDVEVASAFELEVVFPSRFDRGKSEPPEPRPVRPSSGADWDWTRSDLDDSGIRSHTRADSLTSLDSEGPILSHVADQPYLFTLAGSSGTVHTFEVAVCEGDFQDDRTSESKEAAFSNSRITYRQFMEEPKIVDDPRLVVRYNSSYLTSTSGADVIKALAAYRHSIAPVRPSSGVWSRWWRKEIKEEAPKEPTPVMPVKDDPKPATQFAKTLRLSSDQLKQLHLQPGPNTVQFSVTSSYSGVATCSARIFLWDDTDQIVISDIDGTITKSDALGHVFAAIGRDWTHLGIAKLYTDICNNGYKMLYLTSRAIGQADSTREYLKSITQGDYRLPEGPVIMSPDRLMASLHREVIMRKPELFKMACLRDIQRLFGPKAIDAFFAGFGNRITDAMSYRSVAIPTSKIYTIDSTGVVKTELLQAAGHKGSYVALNDLVNEVFPVVKTKFKPEYTDFNYWRADIPSVSLPDLSPPSPALSARSDSSRYSVLGKIIGRRGSKPMPTSEPSSRPSSPLIVPLVPDDLSELDDRSVSSMPGSFESHGQYMPKKESEPEDSEAEEGESEEYRGDSFDDDAIFDDDILATGEMKNVPF